MRVESPRTLLNLQRPSTDVMRCPGVFRLLRLGLTIAVSVASIAACGKANPPPPPTPSVAPVKKAEIAGVETYRHALASEDSEESLRLLEQAVRANPRLAEAWYEVGRRKMKLAPDIVKLDELQGIQVFREGLEAEREALRLLDTGKVTIWNAAEEDEARATLATDLANVDQTLADQESLLRALRVRTY
jgi:tetratricopeptide (TPR) repeat protein